MIPLDLLEKTRLFIVQQFGWEFGLSREKDLERGLCSMARELGIRESTETLTGWLTGMIWSPQNLDILTRYLTVGETYFFREKAQLDFLADEIIPGLIRERKGKNQSIRIWSAGCSTGEEPYSIAIILKSIIPDIQDWKITIIGSDINREFLNKAALGKYSKWSFRETDDSVRKLYFDYSGHHWEVKPEIKKMITFCHQNLTDKIYPLIEEGGAKMDVIFCRNVLMYFAPSQIKIITNHFHQILVKDGWMIPSVVELNDELFPDFSQFSHKKCIVYQNRPGRRYHQENFSVNSGLASKPVIKRPEKKSGSLPKWSQNSSTSSKPDEPYPVKRKTPVELFDTGRYHQCIELSLANYENGKYDPAGLILIVKSYANLGKLDEAYNWGTRLLSIYGSDASQYYLVAHVLLEMNRNDEAENLLKRALYLDPHHLLSHYLMGTIALKSGKQQAGKKYLKNVIEILEQFPDSDIIAEADGITAGRFREMILNMQIKN